MVRENHYPHPCNKTLEHFQEFGLGAINPSLGVKHFHFDVRLFLTRQDSLFVQLQPGIVICLQNCDAMVYGSL
jgi:hypothetical protein